jgi:hypothetical protein
MHSGIYFSSSNLFYALYTLMLFMSALKLKFCIQQIWAGMFDTAKSNKSNNSDGNSKHSSATSTMHSNDSGCATMYSSGMQYDNQDFVSSKSPPRPVTIGPEYINMGDPEKDYINLFACKTNSGGSSSSSRRVSSGKREPPPPPPPSKRKFSESWLIRRRPYF